ncbi:MAG: PHP domain-containing protein [Armatimonadetes bacterium]|nr:PHP domain-containing protein [Armatimonadota bacterium]
MHNPFELPGSFLKGNLHTHTTNSDGKLTPQQAVDLYREAGYDFLALTDHGRMTPFADLDTDGLVMLPGMELHPGTGELGQTHHIVAIGMDEEIAVPKELNLQAALDLIAPLSHFVFIAHPYWTSLTYADILGLTGHVGIEVFNFTCECGIGRGDSGVHWDELLARGERPVGFAVDDAHSHYPDTLGGWVMVKTTDGTASGIIEATLAGSFYSSSGPAIEDVAFESDRATVRCSPCQAVHVICPAPGCGSTTHHLARDGGPYTEVSLYASPDWNPIRIECVDESGRKAWTNPFWRE